MESERTPKCLLNGELFEVRRRRRPRKRWLQDVKDDLRRMRIGKWKEKAANCEGSQSPPRAVEPRKRKNTMVLFRDCYMFLSSGSILKHVTRY
jgi:hypothetical protein